MASDEERDRKIEEVRLQEQSGSATAKQEAAEKRRQIKIFSGKAQRIKKANDARAYGELLREAKIHDGSPEWALAWKYFYGKS